MYCPNCGVPYQEGNNFCENCGKPLTSQHATAAPPSTEPPVPPAAPAPTVNRSDNRTLFCVLSYIGILWLIGMIVSPEKDDPRVRFHVGQGLLLSIFALVLSVFGGIFISVFDFIFSFDVFSWFGWMMRLFAGLLTLVAGMLTLALTIVGIVHAVQGKEEPLPVIGRFAFYK